MDPDKLPPALEPPDDDEQAPAVLTQTSHIDSNVEPALD
jgi:hypothetical protein